MHILFDQGTPAPLRTFLAGHTVVTAFEAGWSDLSNGDLIDAAEKAFDLLITTDQNLKYQQNLAGRTLAILVLLTANWPKLRTQAAAIADLVGEMKAGAYVEFSLS
jgi:predicted nuclease of predicted toxin-antitoxin system